MQFKLKTIASFSFGPIIAGLLGVITLPLISWFFVVEDIGRISIFQAIVSFSTMFLMLGLNQAYVREYHIVNDTGQLLKSIAIPIFILNIFVFLILSLPFFSISKLSFGIDSNIINILVVIGMFCSVWGGLLAHVLRMEERGVAYSLTTIAPKIFLLLFIGCILLFKLENTFQNLLIANLFALFGSLLTYLYLTKNNLLKSFKSKYDYDLSKKVIKFSLPLVLGGVAYWGATMLDRVLIKYFSGFEEVGLYSVSSSIAAGALILSSVFSNIWHPMVYKQSKTKIDINQLQKIIDIMFLIVLFLWTLASTVSFLIVKVLPPGYYEVQYIFIVCLSMPFLVVLSETTVVGIGITRKTVFSLYASVILFILNLILNLILIPKFGAKGAAIASSIAFFFYFIVRTEASIFVWKKIKRWKMYCCLLTYLTFINILVLDIIYSQIIKTILVILFFFILILYKNTVTKILFNLNILKNNANYIR